MARCLVEMNRCNTALCYRWRCRDSHFLCSWLRSSKEPAWSPAVPRKVMHLFLFHTSYLHLFRHCVPPFPPALTSPSVFGSPFGSTVLHLRLRQNLLNPSSRYILGSLHDLSIDSSVPVRGNEEQVPRGQVTPRPAVHRYIPSAAARVGIGCHEVGEQWRSDCHSSLASWNLR